MENRAKSVMIMESKRDQKNEKNKIAVIKNKLETMQEKKELWLEKVQKQKANEKDKFSKVL